MVKLALMHSFVENYNVVLQSAIKNEFEMIVVPINSSGISMETFGIPCRYPDLVLESKQWNENVVPIISGDLSCDSKDDVVRKRSENILRNELNWINHLQGGGAMLLKLKDSGNFNLARIVSLDLNGHLLIEVPLYNPFSAHQVFRSDINSNDYKEYFKSHQSTWQWWHEFHVATNFDSKIKVVLNISDKFYPDKDTVRRWLAEPVDAIILPFSLFELKKDNKPELPQIWLELLKQFFKIKVNVIISVNGYVENLKIYSIYLRKIIREMTVDEHINRDMGNILSFAQQPLSDNLTCEVYEQYEQDPVKYKLYQNAIETALMKRVPDAFKHHIITIIMILGAGRGPLVRAALNASEKTQRKIRTYVIEKNINAIITLRHIKEKLWENKDVELIHTDMREYKPKENADILVSELLGSFGDNELSPECLNSAQRLLKPDGISIPCQYTSFLNPIMSTVMHTQVKDFENNRIGPYGLGSLYSETAYVVLLQNALNIDTPKPVFTFTHPNNEVDNQRYKVLKFQAPMQCVLNGLIGFFEAVLYEDIKISINPETHTRGMISWYPLYFPIKTPIVLKKNEIIEVHFWRCVSSTKVWYEWQIVSPQITAVHNRCGNSYPIPVF